VAKRFRHRIMWWDWLAALVSIAIVAYLIAGGDDFTDRNTLPNATDIAFGVALILLIMEAMRRTNGWIMPFVTSCFLLYALLGPYLPPPWTHKGYEVSRLIGHMYMTLEGIYGVAVDVSSSLIILFTIFGAFLQFSGAGKFFIDFSFSAMGGRPTGAAARSCWRPSCSASFRFGRGHHRYPGLGGLSDARQGRYEKNAAGGLLAAGGWGNHLAAGAGRRRLPDRRVPEDFLSRRHPDGDHPTVLFYWRCSLWSRSTRASTAWAAPPSPRSTACGA